MYFGNLVRRKLTKSYDDDVLTLRCQSPRLDYPEPRYSHSPQTVEGQLTQTSKEVMNEDKETQRFSLQSLILDSLTFRGETATPK